MPSTAARADTEAPVLGLTHASSSSPGIPGVPLHITQRGVNRCAIFLEDEDRRHYLRLLGESAANQELQIHAYVLMGNHVHLLVRSDESGKVSRATRQLGQAYVTAFNRRHRRTGTLWEGRFKSCLVDSDRYLLTAYRYIQLNPVRAATVERPEHHHWSSVHANLALCEDALVTPHTRLTSSVPFSGALVGRTANNANPMSRIFGSYSRQRHYSRVVPCLDLDPKFEWVLSLALRWSGRSR